jgi:hypothetical protein
MELREQERQERQQRELRQLLQQLMLERSLAKRPSSRVRKLSGKAWVPVAYARRADELLAMTITEASDALAEETSKPASDCAKPLKARYIEKLLRELGMFPKARRGSPKQRPK